MARPRSFDRRRVIEAATGQFLRHGLHGTTAEDLCQATGLGRSSLYNAFTSKDALFAECLGEYLDETRAVAAAVVTDPGSTTLDRIATLLRRIAAEERERIVANAPRGCLAVNTVTELADDPDHQDGVERIRQDITLRLDLLSDILRTGQAAGEITKDVSAEGLAAFVNAAIAGLRISSQGGAAPERLDDIVAATLLALEPHH